MAILLVEPNYKNKYPPLGLMKISTYHKNLDDEVTFVKGENQDLANQIWDRIYISTLFTFYFDKTIKTIEYYLDSVEDAGDIYIGGVMATLMSEEIRNYPGLEGINVIEGLLDYEGALGEDEIIIDNLAPDYLIIDSKLNEYLEYEYPTADSYIAYSTRGCIRKCSFCAVPIIEPEYKDYISISDQVNSIKESTGKEMRHLLLMDNNVLASNRFDDIIDEIVALGFGKDENKLTRIRENGRQVTVKRYVDFNQGIDARLLTEDKMEKLSRIAIRPLRIAFDHADAASVKLYKEKIRLAEKYKIKQLSNYVLFNYKDTPQELYMRLQINAELNREFKKKGSETRIYSFPMRFSPIFGEYAKNRTYVAEEYGWTWKKVRSIQAILNATHGVVSNNPDFFYKAFGKDYEEFEKLLAMPIEYITYRDKYTAKSAKWWEEFKSLNDEEKRMIFSHTSRKNDVRKLISTLSNNQKFFKKVLLHYL